MPSIPQLDALEQRTYAGRHDDGLLDLVTGLGLAAIGASWLTDLAWAGGIAPALLVPIWMQLRKMITAPRAGTFRSRPARQSIERRKFAGLTLLGIAVLAAGVALYVTSRSTVQDDWARHTVAAWPGILLAVAAAVTAVIFGLRRFLIYGMVLVAAALAAVEQRLEPGLYMAEVGVFVAAVGAVMLFVFMRNNPPPDLGHHA